MSKDIRSFFISTKQPRKKSEINVNIDNSHEDVIPESPDVQFKNKKKESRRKRVLIDSDDESSIPKKNKSNNLTNKALKIKHERKISQNLKEVKAADIFGNSHIKRTEPLVTKVQKKTETGFHSDDDFDKSLLELDDRDILEGHNTVNNLPSKKTVDKKTAINEQNKSSNGTETSSLKKFQKRSFEESFAHDQKLEDDKKLIKKIKTEMVNNSMNCQEHDESEHSKKKINKSLNESVLTDEERHERKMHSRALYQKYLNRSGPKNLGSKQIPEGSDNCLKDCAFLLTGVLDSFEREEVAAAITKFGGSVKNSMSKKVTHVLAGEEAGPAKLAQAKELGIRIIDEDDFLKLIEDLSKAKSTKKNKPNNDGTENITSSNKITDNKKNQLIKKEKTKQTSAKKPNKKETSAMNSDSITKTNNTSKVEHKNKNQVKTQTINQDHEDEIDPRESNIKMQTQLLTTESKRNITKGGNMENTLSSKCLMWADKYKPQNLKQIIGQHGDNSNVKKLSNWLTKWYLNRKAKLPKPSPWAKNDDGGYFSAALLSGPPGVGKTTTVSLVCQELGYDVVEFNASDTRNKTLIKEQIGELLNTTSLSAYSKGDTGKQAVTKKHVLVMDEVDGMSGNEDRGGLQELIALIKSTSVPIICMCNDRHSQKMKSLLNYVYELKFVRPRIDQIKSAMMSICYKEGIKIPPDVLTQLINAANRDVRQTLNLLSMWAVDPELAAVDRLKKDVAKIKRDVKLGPWDAIHKVFTAEEHKHMSINDKSDLFFYDYSLAPLFVQENYLSVEPHCPKKEVLERVSKTADSISVGDIVEAKIRSKQSWSLLPLQAMYSSVIPGHEMSGHVTKAIQFPGWLGKNSRSTKMQRLCQEIHAHTRLSTSGSKSSIFLDYCSHLRDAVVKPLIQQKSDGVAQALEVLEAYHLLRDDLDSLCELSLWPGQRDPMILVDSKVKAAMTRSYNKNASALPYAPAAVKRGRTRRGDAGVDGDLDGEDDVEAESGDNSDPEADALIKKKKVKEVEKASTSKEVSRPNKGKGKKK